jgi:transcription elongation GreA/GreB family factor
MGAMAHGPPHATLPGVKTLLTELGPRELGQEPEAGRGVIGIGSMASDADNDSGARHRLVSSREVVARGDVTIDWAIGQALLGRRASETVAVVLPDGRTRRLRIACVAAPS